MAKLMNSGHKMVYQDGKYQYEHRLNLEKKIGRKLKRGEQVHHINGQPGDNRPANLQLVTMATHNQIDKKHRMGGRTPNS